MTSNAATPMIASVFLAATFLVALAGSAAADYMTPLGDPGSDAARMRTLNEVEPRTVIESIPVTITNSGSYVLTGNLTATNNTNGITIAVNDVSIDLNGFSLVGIAGTLNGINFSGSRERIYIRNGTIRNWGRCAINAFVGINCRYQDLLVCTNGYGGGNYNAVYIGANGLIDRCIFLDNYGDGLNAADGCKIENSISRRNNYGFSAGKNCLIRGCTATDNDSHGFYTQENCVIADSNAINNKGHGFYTYWNTTISSCSSSTNSENGFHVGRGCVIVQSVTQANSNGFYVYHGSVVRNCSAYGNTFDGYFAWASANIEGCSSTYNGSDGFELADGSTISGCLSVGHSGSSDAGIRAGNLCRIVENRCKDNYYGIFAGAKSYIAQNFLSGGTNGVYVNGSGNTVIVNNYAVDNVSVDYWDPSGNAFGASITNTGTITTNNPWANFAF